MAANPPKNKQVSVTWVGAEEIPLQFANAFLGMVQPGEIYLNIGSVVPPVIQGTPEERKAQVNAIDYVLAKPIARLAFTPARLDEMIKILQETKRNYEALMRVVNNQGESQ